MTAFPTFTGLLNVPGISPALETAENEFLDLHHQAREIPILLAGSTRDAGNTSYTTTIRKGLALGGPIDDGQTDEFKCKEWNPAGTDGSQFFFGFLKYPVNVLDSTGANQDKYTVAVVDGSVYSDRIIVPGNSASGFSGNNAQLLLAQAFPRFLFDKHVRRVQPPFPLPPITLSTLGASPNTLTTAQSGRTFVNTGDVGARTVNLPNPVPGLRYRFHCVAAQDIVLDSGSNTFIAAGNGAANTVTLDGNGVNGVGSYYEVMGYSTTQYVEVARGGLIVLA